MPETMEIYIHIPFCKRKCNYCDFLSFPAAGKQMDSYMEALRLEIARTARDKDQLLPVRSVFFGGGTPSILPPAQIENVLSQIRKEFDLEEDAEISLEANPGTLDREKLNAYYKMGINRLSIGLQSTDNVLLKRLGRIHTKEEFICNYEDARAAGFENINIDLMSGLPGQTLSGYQEELQSVLDLKPEHISSYSLILEEGTPFYEDATIKRMLHDEETDRKMYHKTKEMLLENGYERYEISNYALPGKACRHNLGYWSRIPYLGFGLGASSYYPVDGQLARFSNEPDLSLYLEAPFVSFGERKDYEVLTRNSMIEEYMFLGLRKMEGISLRDFEEQFGIHPYIIYKNVLSSYLKDGYLCIKEDRLFLTEKGIDVSDYIFRDFMLVID